MCVCVCLCAERLWTLLLQKSEPKVNWSEWILVSKQWPRSTRHICNLPIRCSLLAFFCVVRFFFSPHIRLLFVFHCCCCCCLVCVCFFSMRCWKAKRKTSHSIEIMPRRKKTPEINGKISAMKQWRIKWPHKLQTTYQVKRAENHLCYVVAIHKSSPFQSR